MKKIVVITGAGGGLGKSISTIFSQNDFTIIEFDNRFEEELRKTENGILQLKADVSSELSMQKCAGKVQEQYDSVDVLISNAGIFDFFPLSEDGGEALKRIFDVNFFGLANCVKYFLPLLVKSKGRLVTISSESYKIPAPFQPYAVSKQALEKLHFALSQELMLRGISAVLIRPGAIQTNILNETLHFVAKNKNSFFSEEFHHFIDSIPKYIRQVSSPEEVAKLVFRAATAKNAKRTYKINHNPWVSLLSALPPKLQDWSIKQQLK